MINKGIQLWEDVLTFKEQCSLADMVENSLFSLGWTDKSPSKNTENYLHSRWNIEELNRSSFLASSNIKQILKETQLSLDSLDKVVVNLDTMGDTHWTHDHTNQTVLLYYVNTEWLDSWGGETLFFDNFNKDIVYGSSYTPNRVLVFDGEIPHTIRPPSKIFPHKFRFTLTLLFNQPYTTLTLNERNE